MREHKYLTSPESLLRAAMVALILSLGLLTGALLGFAANHGLVDQALRWMENARPLAYRSFR